MSDEKLNKKYDQIVAKLNALKKAIDAPNQSNRTAMPHLGQGWSRDPVSGALHHPMHGIISVRKNKFDKFEAVHNGQVIGSSYEIKDIGQHMLNRVRSLRGGDTAMHNVDPMKLKKSWGQHLPFPSVGDESRKPKLPTGEDVVTSRLADMMSRRNMLHNQPTAEQMIRWGEEIGLGSSPELQKTQDEQWNNSINSWLEEASKPISSRFASEEEELEYWKSIKVSDKDDGDSGY